MNEDQNIPDFTTQHDKVSSVFEQMTDEIQVDIKGPLADLEITTDRLINIFANLMSVNISSTKAEKLIDRFMSEQFKSIDAFTKAYDTLSTEEIVEKELIEIIAQIIYEQQSSLHEFASNIVQQCEECRTNNLDKKTIEKILQDIANEIKENVDEIKEISGDTVAISNEEYLQSRRERFISAYEIGLENDLSHLSEHTPQEYIGRDYNQIALKIGSHVLDIAKITAGVGVALFVFNKFKKQ